MTDIHSPEGIRTRNASNFVAAEPHLAAKYSVACLLFLHKELKAQKNSSVIDEYPNE